MDEIAATTPSFAGVSFNLIDAVGSPSSDWAINCPEYKVTAVQVMPSNGPSEWQEVYAERAEAARRILSTEPAE